MRGVWGIADTSAARERTRNRSNQSREHEVVDPGPIAAFAHFAVFETEEKREEAARLFSDEGGDDLGDLGDEDGDVSA